MEDKYKEIYEFVQSGKKGAENYDSSMEPFMKTNEVSNGEIDFNTSDVNKILEKLPLKGYLKTLYQIIGNKKIEYYFEKWILLSLDKVTYIYNNYSLKNQTKIIDFAVIYGGMGHCIVCSYVPKFDKIYFRHDGGSNGYERDDHFNFACNYNPKESDLHDISVWLKNINNSDPWELPVIN